jgi:hypothetical protein
MLPRVEFDYEPQFGISKVYYTREKDKTSYEELKTNIKNFLILEDCFALTIDDEIIFSFYPDNSKKIRTMIKQDILRNKILNHVENYLLRHIQIRHLDSRIRIYLYSSFPWTINIDYIALEDKFCLSFSQSKDYKYLI